MATKRHKTNKNAFCDFCAFLWLFPNHPGGLMCIKISIAALTLVFLSAIPLFAHHAFGSEFDPNRPVLLKGKVVKVEWVNPHTWIHMEVTNPDGTKDIWMIEGGSPNSLLRRGVTKASLQAGTEIVVDGYQTRDHTLKRANGRNVTYSDGRKLFLASSADAEIDKPNVPQK